MKVLLSIAYLVLAVVGGPAPSTAQVQNPNAMPALLKQVGIDQKLNAQIPLDLTFRDETGKTVELGDYFGRKPVVLALVYYECPMLCTEVLNGMLRSFKNVSFDIGKQYQVVTVSFNPKETSDLAAQKKRVYVGLYGRPSAMEGWHFLTGDEASIHQLAQAVGFRYVYDRESAQYIHATGIMVLTPRGRISRYFYGIQYPSRDVRLGLVEASSERIGNLTDAVLLLCCRYDPKTGKYGIVIQHALRDAGIATVMVLGILLWCLFRLERQRNRRPRRAPIE
jgi:protein SCO1